MPRFVVLQHEKGEKPHFDLMLEHEEVLLTFSFAEFPNAGASSERLTDHRKKYLDFEGNIGEKKGRVSRVERGSFDMLAVESDHLHVFLRGERLGGAFRLVRQADDTWKLEAE